MELEGSHFIKVAGWIVPHENAQVFVARAAMSANVSDLDPVYSHPNRASSYRDLEGLLSL